MLGGAIYNLFSGRGEIEFRYLAEIYRVGPNFIMEFGLNGLVVLDIK